MSSNSLHLLRHTLPRLSLSSSSVLSPLSSICSSSLSLSSSYHPCVSAHSQSLSFHPSRSYHENVVDHFERPRNVGSLPKDAPDVGTGIVGAPACGDVMKVQVKVGEDGVIEKSVFKTFGCASAIASSSLATSWLQGKHVDDAVKIKNTDIAKHLNLPPVKLHCSMLAEDAIKAAVNDFKKKQEAKKAQAVQQTVAAATQQAAHA